MLRSWSKAAAAALVVLPVCAAAFEAVDVLIPASGSIYPAYPGEPVRPYTAWAQAGVMYDTNALRRTAGDNHELITRLGAGGRVEQPVVGRQGMRLEGRIGGFPVD